MVFAIYWHEPAMDLHVFPIPSLWVVPVHQPWARVSCIQPGLVVYFTLDSILVSCYSLRTSHPRLLPLSPKVCSVHLCLFFCFACWVIVTIFLNSKIWNASQICVSSLRRGHPNLCIIPILVYVLPKWAWDLIFMSYNLSI